MNLLQLHAHLAKDLYGSPVGVTQKVPEGGDRHEPLGILCYPSELAGWREFFRACDGASASENGHPFESAAEPKVPQQDQGRAGDPLLDTRSK